MNTTLLITSIHIKDGWKFKTLPLNHRSARVDGRWHHTRCTAQCNRTHSQLPPPPQKWWSSARCHSPAQPSAATRSQCGLGNYCLQTGSESRGSSDGLLLSGDLHTLQRIERREILTSSRLSQNPVLSQTVRNLQSDFMNGVYHVSAAISH